MNEQENIYFRCRKEAALRNDRLNSREGAAELLGLSVSSLSNYELGITKAVPVDSVVMMADLYGAPEMKAYYCKNACPIGADKDICTQPGSIESLAVRMACLAKGDTFAKMTDRLLDIARDGRVSAAEKAELEEVASQLGELEQFIQELRLKADITARR